ncbi:MAG TPA: aminotransferase class I/II-fold pyridoxal phosphate-dependent enzyme [Planctomycetota bacterium]|nr:aminotransferase class I/II-fold pyridoxal phosphate-dependent enzyme [Planctomycetota bacterium]HRR79753.1 aminotransferase class I/II-fold pyridoxal phosphate-dependent enzyme [Planctomycetota bacterium]HRT96302.1 aminotransferase class I/II-fold pyridoxal phosphate-dependent enzyme [Planctomycetota bacterium]
MHEFPSRHAASVPRSRIRELSDLATQVANPLRLYFGESNVPTPAFIKEAAKQAIDEGHTFYTLNAGYLDLRQAIAAQTRRLHGFDYDPDGEVVVTAGGVEALFLAFAATLEPGSKAVILSPCWPNVAAIVQMLGATPVEVPLVENDGAFRVNHDALAAALDPSVRVLFVNSPSNPTGWVMSGAEEAFLADLAAARGVCLILDQVYERIVFDGPVAPVRRLGRLREHLMLLNSLSKAYSMTGWRVGYALGPQQIVEQMTKLQEFVVSHAPAPSQRAALAAITKGEAFVREMQMRYRALRDLACERLGHCPRVELARPAGAFYVFPRIEGLTDSFDFCRRLLLDRGVGLAPGCAFGAGGEGHVRLCFAVEESILAPALDRLAAFLARRKDAR